MFPRGRRELGWYGVGVSVRIALVPYQPREPRSHSLPGLSAGEWPEASCRCFCEPCMTKTYVTSYSISYSYTRPYSSVKTTTDLDLCEHYVKSKH